MAFSPFANGSSNTFGGLLQQASQYPSYMISTAGISESISKHGHIDLKMIDWKDITIIKGNQKITVTPEELAIKLGLEW